MKKMLILSAALIIACLVLSTACFLPAKSQSNADVSIEADGNIVSVSAPIQQTGNIYTLTGNIFGLYVYRNNSVIDGNGSAVFGAFLLDKVSNVTVKNLVVSGGGHFGSSGLTAGIYLSHSSNILVANNTLRDVHDFVTLFGSYQPVAAIIVKGGHSNVFLGNNFSSNYQGIGFYNTEHNLVVENTFESTIAFQKKYGSDNPAGVFFCEASNNTIYHNNFKIEKIDAAFDYYYNTFNIWDDGYPSGGNYWSDYSAGEIGDSGLGDRPYVIDAHNNDSYPLLEPFNRTFTDWKVTPPKVALAASVNESSVALGFNVDKAVNWTGYSLDGQQNVTLAGNTTLAGLSSGSHSITVYANDTYGNMGASETLVFTVAEPFPAMAVAAVAAAAVAAAVSAAVLWIYRRRR